MPDISPMHERLLSVIGDHTYRSLARKTDSAPETVRRYLQGQAPSVEFISAVCEHFDLNANWLLTGEGVKTNTDQRAETLRTSSPADLLAAVAEALEMLTSRVDRLERFVQRVETRFNTVEVKLRSVTPNAPSAAQADAPGGGATARAAGVARAVSKRPPQDAD